MIFTHRFCVIIALLVVALFFSAALATASIVPVLAPVPTATPVYEILPRPTPVLILCRKIFVDDAGRYWCWPVEEK